MSDSTVLVIAGATAAGKTQLALDLALRFDAEIVGADSRQIYSDMPIGTAAPPSEALSAVRHHCVAVVDPYERYSAGRFERDALAAIVDIQRARKARDRRRWNGLLYSRVDRWRGSRARLRRATASAVTT